MARIDTIAKAALAEAEDGRQRAGAIDKAADPAAWRHWRARAVSMKYLVIYRTLADPAYLDLSIDPDERPLGSLFAFPDPLDANYGRGGLARTMTARGWLSTWSGLSRTPSWPTPCRRCRCRRCSCTRRPTPRSGCGRRKEIIDNAGAADTTLVEMKGAPHYLEGHRPEALAIVADWLNGPKRFPLDALGPVPLDTAPTGRSRPAAGRSLGRRCRTHRTERRRVARRRPAPHCSSCQ